MKVIDVRFRDPVQVGGITASARVSWRREDGPCSVSDGYVTCGDTLVPLTNVAWLRVESPARIAVTEQASVQADVLAQARAHAISAPVRPGISETEPYPCGPVLGKGKKR